MVAKEIMILLIMSVKITSLPQYWLSIIITHQQKPPQSSALTDSMAGLVKAMTRRISCKNVFS
jgi:hypothetical protein